MNRATTALGVATVLLVSEGQGSAFPSSRLVYTRGAGAEACPDESVVRSEVRSRLGYDPFYPSADRTITVVITLHPEGLEGRAELVDANGAVRGLREFTAPADRCDDLVHAIALSLSIAIDPTRAEPDAASQGATSSSSPPHDESPPDPALAQPVGKSAPGQGPSPPDDRRSERLEWQAGLGIFGSLLTAPSPRVGGLLFGTVLAKPFSLTVEPRGELPAAAPRERREFVSSLVELRVVPCVELGRDLRACGIASPGILYVSGPSGNPAARTHTPFVFAIGARLAFDRPLTPVVSLRLHADALAHVRPVEVESGEDSLWTSEPISGSLGAALVIHFR